MQENILPQKIVSYRGRAHDGNKQIDKENNKFKNTPLSKKETAVKQSCAQSKIQILQNIKIWQSGKNVLLTFKLCTFFKYNKENGHLYKV